MRKLLILSLLSLFTSLSFGQTDSLNQVKYWKFRNNFVEKFIKIGPEVGESLPAGSLVPAACIDNVAYDGTDPSKYQITDYGEIHWGDGMIRHGHYLALLATEYALKKKYNQDLTGTLNELYYALHAINRLDLIAESALNHEYGTSFVGTMNGFALREDIPEDFALHWKDEPMNFGCTNSAFYTNNNVAKIRDLDKGLVVKQYSSFQNDPSMDQMSSLMVGMLLIKKLVDSVYIKPKPTDQGFNIITEAQAIVQRMVMYASDRNWELIDVNGWPVANGGGDLSASAYPYVMAAHRITGNPIDTYADHFYRRRLKYHPKFFEMQHCITGFGTSGGLDVRQAACDKMNMTFLKPGLKSLYKKMEAGAIPGPLNNQNNSVYYDWNSSGYRHSIFITKGVWDNKTANFTSSIFQTIKDEVQEAGLRSMEGVSSFNQAIVFNLGVTAGHWKNSMAHYFGNKTENRQLELTNIVLYDQRPVASKAFYQSYLNSMPMTGAYNIIGKNWTPNPEGPWHIKFQCAQNGWGADFRWTEPDQAFGDDLKEGVYSSLDYMILHNLYYLIYADQLPEFKQEFNCICEKGLSFDIPETLDAEELEAYKKLKGKLKNVPTCQPNVFAPVYNRISGQFNVKPQFPDYPELGIETVRYQTENASIENAGVVNIRSHFIIYSNKTLTVKEAGRINTLSGDIFLRNGAQIILAGELRIGAGTSVIINSDATLVVQSGARIVVEEGGQFIIEEDGIMEIYEGGEVITLGEEVDLVLQGSIKMRDGGTFTVTRQMR